ncbi:MAG: sugar phosphate isomerase/epimerase [Acidimicrobiales bacterium]|nr:sugar phosphate isomerase/epimerase [Acidimicrobiales bacterium]
MSGHPRISVHQWTTRSWSLDEDLAHWESAGIPAVGLAMDKLAATGDPVAAAERVRASGVHVTGLLARGPFSLDRPERWPDQRAAMDTIMDTALAARPDALVLTTGPAGAATWERAADAFADVLQGTMREAEREHLPVLLEPTHALRADLGFVHQLRDAVELGWRVGMGVCLDVQACWSERNLAGTIGAAIDSIGLVQVSDYRVGTRCTPDRLVPGDGDVPLERILRFLLDAGYDGWFDLEVLGPAVDEEGYAAVIERSRARLGDLLEALGA